MEVFVLLYKCFCPSATCFMSARAQNEKQFYLNISLSVETVHSLVYETEKLI